MLRNKVRFITSVISGDIVINRVKRKVIAATLWAQQFTTITQLNDIQKDEKRVTVVENNEDSEQAAAGRADEDNLQAGEVKPSEYDYLLTMPLWSLSEERVEELIELMKKKKQELETLRETHVYTLWDRDLDEFLRVLDKYEDEEERDRKAHQQQKGDSNQRQRKRAKPKAIK